MRVRVLLLSPKPTAQWYTCSKPSALCRSQGDSVFGFRNTKAGLISKTLARWRGALKVITSQERHFRANHLLANWRDGLARWVTTRFEDQPGAAARTAFWRSGPRSNAQPKHRRSRCYRALGTVKRRRSGELPGERSVHIGDLPVVRAGPGQRPIRSGSTKTRPATAGLIDPALADSKRCPCRRGFGLPQPRPPGAAREPGLRQGRSLDGGRARAGPRARLRGCRHQRPDGGIPGQRGHAAPPRARCPKRGAGGSCALPLAK